MKSNSRVLRGWRDFGVKATAIILTILLATQMVGTPAFASGALTNKQASEDIATTVDDTGVEPSGTEATDTTVPDEAAGAANEPAPADSTQATEEPVVETVESATEPATETPAADPAANTVLGSEPEPAPAPAVEQDQLASIKLNLADGASITLSKDGNKIDDDTNPVDVPVNEELKFTAQAAKGWQIDKVKTVIDGVETELTADANGEYKVAADKVTDKLTVKVEASAVETAAEESTGEVVKSSSAAINEDEKAIEATDNKAAANSVSPLNISGQKQVAIGETIRLSSDSPASSGGWIPETYTHKWTASPSNAVSFSNTSHSGADVTGNRVGTVTINHEWGYDLGWFGWQKEGSETYTITVYQADEEDLCTITFDTNGGSWNNSLNGTHKFVMGHELWPEGQDLSAPTREGFTFEGWTPAVSRVVSDDATYTAQWKPIDDSMTPVYVYLQVDGDKTGLVLNHNGWFTIGVIYMPSWLVPNDNLSQDQTVDIDTQLFRSALNDAMGDIVRYAPNASLVIDQAEWDILHVQSGANDYVPVGLAWHLDGSVDAAYLANLTVNHIDVDTQEVLDTETTVRTVGTSVDPDDMVGSFKNYTYVSSEPSDAITIQKDSENVINIYYQKNADRLFYDANGGEGTMSPSVGKAEEEVTVDENGFTRDGYEFTGWNTQADGKGKNYEPGDKYTLTDGEDKLFAQWKQVIFPGTPITVQVEKDGEHISADGVVKATEYEAGGGTADFKSTLNDDGNLSITYTYDNLNCADITLDVVVPEGYGVEVVSDKTGTTTGEVNPDKSAEFKLNGSDENWTLDNTPGGATVTVKLTKKEFTVSYKADNGGQVSEDSETVKYGEDAKGSTATPSEGYYFVNWTDEDGNEVSTDAAFAPKSVRENATYTAHFAKKMEVSITGKSATDLIYDGSEQSVSGFEGETAGSVPVNVDGQTYYVKDVTSTASGTNAMAEAENTTIDTDNLQVFDADGNDVTDRFTVTVNPGKFKINKRPVTFTGNSDTKAYNGSEQSVTGFTTNDGEGTGLVSGQTSNVEASAKGTVAGTYAGTITDAEDVKIMSGEQDVTANYAVTTAPGTLTITGVEGEIAIAAASSSHVYDGEAYTDATWTSNAEGILLGGDELVVTVEGSATNVGDEGVNSVASYKVMRGDLDVTKSYTFAEPADGKLTITPRPVTFTTDSAAKIFDGITLTAEGYEITSGSFVEGETYGVDFGNSGQTAAGQSDNNATVVFAGEGNEFTAQSGNYNVTVVPGKLTVYPQSIDPEDPDPETPDPDDPTPDDPDPENPDQPF